MPWEFPGGPVVKNTRFNAGDMGLIPGWGTKISHASQARNQSMKQKQYCEKFNNNLKNTQDTC